METENTTDDVRRLLGLLREDEVPERVRELVKMLEALENRPSCGLSRPAAGKERPGRWAVITIPSSSSAILTAAVFGSRHSARRTASGSNGWPIVKRFCKRLIGFKPTRKDSFD